MGCKTLTRQSHSKQVLIFPAVTGQLGDLIHMDKEIEKSGPDETSQRQKLMSFMNHTNVLVKKCCLLFIASLRNVKNTYNVFTFSAQKFTRS